MPRKLKDLKQNWEEHINLYENNTQAKAGSQTVIRSPLVLPYFSLHVEEDK